MNCDILPLPLSPCLPLASLHALLIIEILSDPCHSLHALADPPIPSPLPSFISAALPVLYFILYHSFG